MIALCWLLLFCWSCCVCDERVIFAALVFRHGDRTPVDPYPTDPWRNESLWPVRFGELTNIGKMQHFKLGQWLRKRYSHLISEKFDPLEVYVRSTDVDRTLMSAQANLAGLYPPVDGAVWNPELMWQPIPVHTVPEREDELLAMQRPCAAYERRLADLVRSQPYQDRLSRYRELMDYLSRQAGTNVSDYYGIDSIYSVLSIERLYNFTLPAWTEPVFPDRMAEPAGYSFKVNTLSPFLARVKVGPLLRELVSLGARAAGARARRPPLLHEGASRGARAAGARARRPPLRLALYSGHDLTVASLLNGLGLYDGRAPDYTATVFFEILEEEKSPAPAEYFVRLSYRATPETAEPAVLAVPRCGARCPLPAFRRLYRHLLAVDWDRDCAAAPLPPLPPPAPAPFAPIAPMAPVALVAALALLSAVYVAHKLHFARVSRQYRSKSSPEAERADEDEDEDEDEEGGEERGARRGLA